MPALFSHQPLATAAGPSQARARRAATLVTAPSAQRCALRSCRVAFGLSAASRPARRSIVLRYRESDEDLVPAAGEEEQLMEAGAAGQDLVPVEFVLGHRCAFGHKFALVGDCEVLGCWDVARARPLEWHDGDTWSAVLALPPNRPIAFKPVIVSAADGSCIMWADDITGGSGRNLTVTITEGAEVGAGAHVELLPETSGSRRPFLTARLPAAVSAELADASAVEAAVAAAASGAAATAAAAAEAEHPAAGAQAHDEISIDEAIAADAEARMHHDEMAAEILARRVARGEAPPLAALAGAGDDGDAGGASTGAPPLGRLDPSVLPGAGDAAPAADVDSAPAVPPPVSGELITAAGDVPVVVNPDAPLASAKGGEAFEKAAESLLEVVPGTQVELVAGADTDVGAGAEEGAAAAAAETPAAPASAASADSTDVSAWVDLPEGVAEFGVGLAGAEGAIMTGADAADVAAGASLGAADDLDAAGAAAYEARVVEGFEAEAAKAAAAFGGARRAEALVKAAAGAPAAVDANEAGKAEVERMVKEVLAEKDATSARRAAASAARAEAAAEERAAAAAEAAAGPAAVAAVRVGEGAERAEEHEEEGGGILGNVARLFKHGKKEGASEVVVPQAEDTSSDTNRDVILGGRRLHYQSQRPVADVAAAGPPVAAAQHGRGWGAPWADAGPAPGASAPSIPIGPHEGAPGAPPPASVDGPARQALPEAAPAPAAEAPALPEPAPAAPPAAAPAAAPGQLRALWAMALGQWALAGALGALAYQAWRVGPAISAAAEAATDAACVCPPLV